MTAQALYASADDLVGDLWNDKIGPEDATDQVSPFLVDASRAIDDWCHRNFTVPAAATPRLYRPTRDGSMVDLLDDIAKADDLTVEVRSSATGEWVHTAHWYPVVDNGTGVYAAGMVTGIYPAGGRRFARDGHAQTIRITAWFGWPAVPAPVRRACLLLANRLAHRADNPSGTLSYGDLGAVRILSNDPDVKRLLAPYRRRAGSFR